MNAMKSRIKRFELPKRNAEEILSLDPCLQKG